MNPLTITRGVCVLDGGFSSQLEKEGCPVTGDPLWGARAIITDPKKVIAVHKKYLAAGAQIIETSSYQAAIPTLRSIVDIGNQSKAENVVKESVSLARQAITEFCEESGRKSEEFLVAGSIGPYATVLHDGSEYSGKYISTTPKQTIFDYFRNQVNSLMSAGVDLLAFETVPTLAESKIIVDVLESLSQPIFAWISFTCKDGLSTWGGDKFMNIVSTLNSYSVVSMIGINCTGTQFVETLLDQGSHHKKPFVVYPNSGEIWDNEKGWLPTEEMTPLSIYVPQWVARGVKVIGGCCRIGPDGIKEITTAVSKLNNACG